MNYVTLVLGLLYYCILAALETKVCDKIELLQVEADKREQERKKPRTVGEILTSALEEMNQISEDEKETDDNVVIESESDTVT